jgi:site-specific DNA recombinase
VQDRRLQVNTTEAKTINEIYSQYLVLRSVKSLKQHLDNQGIVSKQRVSSDGKHTGGKPISRGNLYRILSNPIYKGEIRHKQETHPGQHEAIIDPDTWDQVQQLLASNNDSAKKGLKAKQPSLLAGLLFDDKGHPMSPSHAVKNGKRYRYYTSQALIKQQHGKAGSLPRVPAAEIENIALLQVRQLLQDRNRMADILDGPIHEKEYALNQAQLVASTLEAKPYLLKDLISKVTISASKILIEVPISAVLKILNLPGAQNDHKIVLTEKIKLKRCQGEKRLILENGQPSQIDNLNPALIKAISRAYTWNQMLINGEADSLKSLAKMEQMTCRYIRKLLPLAYLPPSLIEDILSGKQDQNLSVESLC